MFSDHFVTLHLSAGAELGTRINPPSCPYQTPQSPPRVLRLTRSFGGTNSLARSRERRSSPLLGLVTNGHCCFADVPQLGCWKDWEHMKECNLHFLGNMISHGTAKMHSNMWEHVLPPASQKKFFSICKTGQFCRYKHFRPLHSAFYMHLPGFY